MIERREDGTETLSTVDGLRLDLDGKGGLRVNGSSEWTGTFMVIEHERPANIADH